MNIDEFVSSIRASNDAEVARFFECYPSARAEDLFTFSAQQAFIAERTANHFRRWHKVYGDERLAVASDSVEKWTWISRELSRLFGTDA